MKKTIHYRSKKDFAYHSLRQGIIEGHYQPGQRLIIDDLAHHLEVSPIPVREALQKLQADGFVTIEPHVGASVTEVNLTLIDEIFELLAATEIISCQFAARRMTAKDLETLRDILTAMDAAQDDFETWSAQNLAMHHFLCDCGKTPLVKSVMGKVLDQWDRLRHLYLKDVFPNRVAEAQTEHWAIYQALVEGDSTKIEAAVHQHNRNAKRAYAQHLNKGRR